MLGSANRDERQFERPDDLDITREPNRHLAFGQGVHYCVGAPLARLEGQIAINTLLRRFPDLKLAVPPHALRRRRGLGLRGLASLPVSLSRRASLDLKPVSLHPGSKVRSSSVRPAAGGIKVPAGHVFLSTQQFPRRTTASSITLSLDRPVGPVFSNRNPRRSQRVARPAQAGQTAIANFVF